MVDSNVYKDNHNSKNTATAKCLAWWGYWPLVFLYNYLPSMITVMSSPRTGQSSSDASNQFIRPTSAFNVHSTAARLASRGKGFASSIEVAEVISGGVATNLVQALMTALGRHFEDLVYKVMMALTDLYSVVLSTRREADEVAGSQLLSRALSCSAKDSLSSFEDDLSFKGSPLGHDDIPISEGMPPVTVHHPAGLQSRKPGQCQKLCSLPERMRELSVEDKRSDVPDGCPVTALVQPVHMLS